MTTAHLIINGKKAGIPAIRDAVGLLRDKGHSLQVRVTWEYGDGLRYVKEAGEAGVDCVIAGGGDGTVNAVLSALVTHAGAARLRRIKVGAVGLGSSNDFHKPFGTTLAGIPCRLDRHRLRDHDIGRLDYEDPQGNGFAWFGVRLQTRWSDSEVTQDDLPGAPSSSNSTR